jgi:predicted enzyme related to lactoylglutathione lyase
MSTKVSPVLIFVRRFEQCLRFYQQVFNMKTKLVYRGRKHPRFAILKSENLLLELHGGYNGPRHRIEPVAIHFEVSDIKETLTRLDEFGGRPKHAVREVEWFPQNLRVLETTFLDPDGNEFVLFQKASGRLHVSSSSAH